MAKTLIVNKDDKVIGAKERDEIKDGDICRVAALWLTNQKGEVLIARRAYSKKHDPGKWGAAVAGTLDEGEDYLSNITKETEEEIGLTDLEFTKGPYGLNDRGSKFFYQWFISSTDKDISDMTIDAEEVAELRWISKEKLIEEVDKYPDEYITAMDEWRDMFV